MNSAAARSQSGVVYGISHVDVPVTNMERSEQFYAKGLGFHKKQSGEGWVDLDASSMLVRLVETPAMDRRSALRIQVSDVQKTWAQLLNVGGRKLYEEMLTPDHELLASVADPDGNTITVWRALTEDEYDFVPELPVKTAWSPESQVLLKELLLDVPALFRGLARRKIVRLAEEIFPDRVISRNEAIRAYILASAKITRYRMREPLKRHGINPDDFRQEFEEE